MIIFMMCLIFMFVDFVVVYCFVFFFLYDWYWWEVVLFVVSYLYCNVCFFGLVFVYYVGVFGQLFVGGVQYVGCFVDEVGMSVKSVWLFLYYFEMVGFIWWFDFVMWQFKLLVCFIMLIVLILVQVVVVVVVVIFLFFFNGCYGG